MPKLLIADHSDVRTDALTKALETKWEIHTCSSSYPVIDTMKYINPDALIIDLSIGPQDGLSVLERAFPNLPPVIMALSNYVSPQIYDTAGKLGVGCLLRIPCNPDYVAAQLNEMFNAHLDKRT